MGITLEFQPSIKAGETFTISNLADGPLYMFVEHPPGPHDTIGSNQDMCPMKILDLHTGKIQARNTSWGLCLRDMDLHESRITFRGNVRFR